VSALPHTEGISIQIKPALKVTNLEFRVKRPHKGHNDDGAFYNNTVHPPTHSKHDLIKCKSEACYGLSNCFHAAVLTCSVARIWNGIIWVRSGTEKISLRRIASKLIKLRLSYSTIIYKLLIISYLTRGPLSLVSTTEELLDRKVEAPV
jgi:hypothetical protein